MRFKEALEEAEAVLANEKMRCRMNLTRLIKNYKRQWMD